MSLKQLIQVVFTLTGFYVGSIIFIINILVITIGLFLSVPDPVK